MAANARSTTLNCRDNTPLGRVTRKFRVVLTGGRPPAVFYNKQKATVIRAG